MITGDLNNHVDRYHPTFWSNGISNSLTGIEQISYLLFIQELDDEELTREKRASQPGPGLFVAQATGESMIRRIPNGAWCIWRTHPTGTRQNQVVLAQHHAITDPDHGGRYTVKVYESEKVFTDNDSWRHATIRLKPDSHDPSFQPIVIDDNNDGELSIIAELVEVLG